MMNLPETKNVFRMAARAACFFASVNAVHAQGVFDFADRMPTGRYVRTSCSTTAFQNLSDPLKGYKRDTDAEGNCVITSPAEPTCRVTVFNSGKHQGYVEIAGFSFAPFEYKSRDNIISLAPLMDGIPAEDKKQIERIATAGRRMCRVSGHVPG